MMQDQDKKDRRVLFQTQAQPDEEIDPLEARARELSESLSKSGDRLNALTETNPALTVKCVKCGAGLMLSQPERLGLPNGYCIEQTLIAQGMPEAQARKLVDAGLETLRKRSVQ
jgi:hypothetical protein